MCAQSANAPSPLAPNGIHQLSRLRILPPGQITPAGWLGRYALITADAWLLHYARNEDPEVYGKFWPHNRNSRAEVPRSARTTRRWYCRITRPTSPMPWSITQRCSPDSELAGRLQSWIDQLLESQDADGYIGAFQPTVRWQNWPGHLLAVRPAGSGAVPIRMHRRQPDCSRRASGLSGCRWPPGTARTRSEAGLVERPRHHRYPRLPELAAVDRQCPYLQFARK